MARQIDITKLERLEKATISLVNLKGYASTTISEIAKEGGISTGYLYRHYKSKEELVRSIYERVLYDFDLHIDGQLNKPTGVREDMERIISYMFDQANNDSETSHFLCLLVYEQAFNVPQLRNKKTAEQCKKILMKGHQTGEIRKDVTPEHILITLFTIPVRLIEARLAPGSKKRFFTEKDVKIITDICMNSVSN